MRQCRSWYVLLRHEGLVQEFKRLESEDTTGTLALESELDSAVRILDYRLSCAKSPEAQDIYKYRISVLSCKIQKT